MEITKGEKKLLVLAHNRYKITANDALLVYHNKQYATDQLKRLALLGYLALTEFGEFMITAKGKESLGIQEDAKLTNYVNQN